MPTYFMRGVQFFTDHQGNKTAALVDVKEHSQFWTDVLEECGEPVGFQFLVNEQGEKIAVLLDFENHGELWKDFYDGLAIEARKDEPRVAWEEVKRHLESERELSV